MTVEELSERILDEGTIMHYDDQEESVTNQNGSTLIHYGIPGMRWGVRKDKKSLDNKSTNKKKKIPKGAIIAGVAAVSIGLASYGAYKFHKSVRDERLDIAIKRGKQYIEKSKKMDKSLGVFDLFDEKYYENIIKKDYIDQAKSEKFSEAYKIVKEVRSKRKLAERKHEEDKKRVERFIKEIEHPKSMFSTTVSILPSYLRAYPEIFEELGITVKDGILYKHGKRLN